MKTLLVLILLFLPCFGIAQSAPDRGAGPEPERYEDGAVVLVDELLRRRMKDPDSIIYEKWDVKLGKSPGGNPAWVVTVTYRAKNSFGAYTGNVRERYWFTPKGEVRQIF